MLGARARWYDRNPVTIGYAYEATGVAPHAATERAAYTVPADRKAFVTSALSAVRRETGAGAAGNVNAYVRVTGSPDQCRLADAWTTGNNVGDGATAALGLARLLLAGQAAKIYTSDPSTGGTGAYTVSFSATEFDA